MIIERIEDTSDFVLETHYPQSFERNEKSHWHTNYEIIYAKSGSLRLSICKRSYDLRSGDFAVIKSCDYHDYMSNTTTPTVLECIRFSPKHLSLIGKLTLEASFITRRSDLQAGACESAVHNALQGIYSFVEDGSTVSQVLLSTYLVQLYLLLMNHYYPQDDNGTPLMAEFEHLFPNYRYGYESHKIGDKTMGKFQGILEFVNINFADSALSLAELSQLSGLSECYISELFPTIIGIHFKQYLCTLRTENALKLLATENITIAEAAMKSGFDTIRTFNNVFKRLKGVTPTEFLKGTTPTDPAGLISEFSDLRFHAANLMKYVYGGSCEIVPYANPALPQETVIGVITHEKNKVWTSFNVNMVFRAGATYAISFDIYCLPDVNGDEYEKNAIGLNFFYADNPQKTPMPHSHGSYTLATDGQWHHCTFERTVSKEYVPGLYDKFSIFGHPANDVGINFLVDHVSCVLIKKQA